PRRLPMAPTLLRGNPTPGTLGVPQTRSVCNCAPTPSVGTISRAVSSDGSEPHSPYRRPSAGATQEVSGMDAAKGGVGPRMAHLRRPPERHRSEGSPTAQQSDPDVGARFLFGYFLFARAKRK